MKKLFAFDHAVSISPSIIVFSVTFILGLWFLFYIKSVVAMLFVAVIIMSAINPSVSRLERKLRIPRSIGIGLMYILVVSILSMTLAVVVPPLALEFSNLTKSLNIDIPPIQNELKNFKFSLTEINNLIDNIGGSIGTVFGLVSSTFSSLFTVFTISVMSVYLLMDRKNLYKKVYWFTKDDKYLQKAELFINMVEQQLGGWIRGQIILMTIIGFITYLGLMIIGVPYALPLALIAGFLEILPNLGPTIAAIPSLLLAYMFGGPAVTVVTLFFYLIVQQLENNLIVPKVMKDNADVNPLTTIVVILIGVQLAGVMGALLSVPAYIVFRIWYSLWWMNKE